MYTYRSKKKRVDSLHDYNVKITVWVVYNIILFFVKPERYKKKL